MGRRSSKPDPIPAPTQAPQRVVFDGGAIGLSLARRKSDNKAVVVSVVPNGAAQAAGVISGDAVTAVDDGDAGSYADVVRRLEGRRPVSLGFMRGGELEDILASMTAVKRAFSQTKRAENEQRRDQRRKDAIQKRISEMRPATHDSLFNVSLMPPGGCAWKKIQAGAPPPLNHIKDALAKVSGPPPPFIDDMAGKDECWYPTGIGNPRFRSLGYRTLKSMPAYERLQVKQDIEKQVSDLKQQKREQGLTDKEFLRLKGLQGDLAGVTYWANPTRKKNRLERMEREHNATLRRRTISARAIERELHIAEDIAETQRRTAANLAA